MGFEDQEGASRRRGTDPLIELIAHKVGRVEQGLDKLADAVSKLAVIEERQVSDRAALERAFMTIQKTDERSSAIFEKLADKLDKLDTRTEQLEKAAPMAAQTSQWVMTAVWAMAAAAAMYAAKKLGIIE